MVVGVDVNVIKVVGIAEEDEEKLDADDKEDDAVGDGVNNSTGDKESEVGAMSGGEVMEVVEAVENAEKFVGIVEIVEIVSVLGVCVRAALVLIDSNEGPLKDGLKLLKLESPLDKGIVTNAVLIS